jgi:hypothetical protein
MLSDFSFAEDSIGFIVEGDVDREVMYRMGKSIQGNLVENKKMCLYLEDMDIRTFSFRAIFIGILFPFRFSHKFSRMALVSDRKWIHFIAFLQNAFFQFSVKSFSTENRLEAMRWIMDQ